MARLTIHATASVEKAVRGYREQVRAIRSRGGTIFLETRRDWRDAHGRIWYRTGKKRSTSYIKRKYTEPVAAVLLHLAMIADIEFNEVRSREWYDPLRRPYWQFFFNPYRLILTIRRNGRRRAVIELADPQFFDKLDKTLGDKFLVGCEIDFFTDNVADNPVADAKGGRLTLVGASANL